MERRKRQWERRSGAGRGLRQKAGFGHEQNRRLFHHRGGSRDPRHGMPREAARRAEHSGVPAGRNLHGRHSPALCQYRGQNVSFDDLVSEGNIGLMKAAARYSPYPGKRFVNFAAPIVRDCIERFIDNHSGLYKVPRGESSPSESRRSHPVSVDAPIPAGSTNNFNLLNLLENIDSPYADKHLTQEDVNARIVSLFSLLDDRERRVMTLIYGIDTDRHTMAEVGMLMDIKRERVRQIRDRAVRRLKKNMKLFRK